MQSDPIGLAGGWNTYGYVGGAIWMKSEAGKGGAFTVRLPANVANRKPAPVKVSWRRGRRLRTIPNDTRGDYLNLAGNFLLNGTIPAPVGNNFLKKGRLARQAMQYDTMSKNSKKPEPERDTDRKTRRCLVCGMSFQSEWAGERICRKCKSTASWRTG